MAKVHPHPIDIQIIGSEIAIRWSDQTESYFPMDFLRAWSPSAENMGESDIFGQVIGGTPGKTFSGIQVLNWEFLGNYAVRFHFSDGHRTGLYSYPYLKNLEEKLSPS